MSLNVIREEICVLLDTLAEQKDIIMKHKQRIPQIEIDIMMSNIRKLYEFFHELDKLNSMQRTPSGYMPETREQDPVFNENQEEEKPKETMIPDVAPEEDRMKIPVEEIKIPPPPQEIVEKQELPAITEVPKVSPVADTKKGGKEKKSLPDLFAETEKISLADKYKNSGQTSVHERISTGKSEKTVADKIGDAPLPDLKAAIGINDKFLFINELFKGDLQEYNRTIDRLNAASVMADAEEILEEKADQFEWSKKADVEARLKSFVNRKFS
jgi:hypothetical protein